jgi:hypothetical protein
LVKILDNVLEIEFNIVQIKLSFTKNDDAKFIRVRFPVSY